VGNGQYNIWKESVTEYCKQVLTFPTIPAKVWAVYSSVTPLFVVIHLQHSVKQYLTFFPANLHLLRF